jgi:hypothetical protein
MGREGMRVAASVVDRIHANASASEMVEIHTRMEKERIGLLILN